MSEVVNYGCHIRSTPVYQISSSLIYTTKPVIVYNNKKHHSIFADQRKYSLKLSICIFDEWVIWRHRKRDVILSREHFDLYLDRPHVSWMLFIVHCSYLKLSSQFTRRSPHAHTFLLRKHSSQHAIRFFISECILSSCHSNSSNIKGNPIFVFSLSKCTTSSCKRKLNLILMDSHAYALWVWLVHAQITTSPRGYWLTKMDWFRAGEGDGFELFNHRYFFQRN